MGDRLRRRTGRGLLGSALALVLVATSTQAAAPATPGAGSPASAVSPAGPCPLDGVAGIPLPGADLATLATDAAALGGVPVWIVGVRAGKGVSRRPWVVRSTDAGWKRVSLPTLGPDAGLMAVDATSRTKAWAVGFSASGRTLSPVSARWDGTAWTAVPIADGAPSETLADISIAPDGTPWAVGYRFAGDGPRPVSLRWTGSAWVRHEPPLQTGRFGALVAVDSDDPTGPWAVGWQGWGTAPRPLLLHRVADRWQAVTTGLEPDGETVLTGLDATADGRVAVTGYHQADGRLTAVVWRLGPGGWSSDPDVAAIAGSFLPDDVLLDERARPVVVGGYRAPTARVYGAFVARATLGGWGLAPEPGGTRPRGHLRSLLAVDPVIAIGWSAHAAAAVALCGSLPDAPAPAAKRWLRHRMARSATTGAHASADRARDPADRPDAPTVAGRPRPAGSLPGPGTPVDLPGITFRDRAVAEGIDIVATSYGATVLDIDADGLPDLAISRHIAPGAILRNTGDGFVTAASDPLPTVDRHGCAAADVDGVAGDELFCAVGAARGMRLKTNELWLDLDGAHPRQRAAAWGVDDPLARGRRATFLDLDGDPWPDLLVSSDPVRVDGLPSLVRAYRDTGGTGFMRAPGMGLELPVSGACALSADLDGDGIAEVVLCTEERWAGSPSGAHVWSRAATGRFADVTTALGIKPGGDVDAAAGDLDGDGLADLVQLSAGRLAVNLQRDGIQQRVLTLAVTAGTAVAIGDADGDGHPDLYVVQGGRSTNAPDLLLRNDGDGTAFTSVRIPQAARGSADDVVVLDHDANGTDDFLVTNGAAAAGPVQLIAGVRQVR